MFHMGWFNFRLCDTLSKDIKNRIDLSTANLCVEGLDLLKQVAENDNIRILFIGQNSMSLLGEMHEKGIGTKPSRYLAADWHIKSARASHEYGHREAAIRSLESALNLVPDHPAGLELRAVIFR